MGMIANAGGHNSNNPANDYRVKPWYWGRWDAVLRSPDRNIAELAANMAIAAANNNNVIYMFGGTSYHTQLAQVGYDPSATSVTCGTDCMGTCFANIKGAMARLGMDNSILPNLGTSNADALMRAGFQKFTDADHVRTDANAMRGDVYVNYGEHACMHVGDGNLNGDLSGLGYPSNTGNLALNLSETSPYIVKIPESATSFDGDMFKESQICGVALSAGYLYSSKTHLSNDSYIAKNLHKQVKCADKYNLPFALIAEVRARSVSEAKLECDKLYYVCAAHVPVMSLWLHLDFSTSKSINNQILEYYIDRASSWGFKNTLGIYVTQDELDMVDWDDYSDVLYLWKVDHTLDVKDYVGVLPFSNIGDSGFSSIGSVSGEMMNVAGWDFDDESYVDRMRAYAQLHGSNSGFFITIDGAPPCRVVIFKQGTDGWTAIGGWYCGVGRKTTSGGSRTVPGVHEIRYKWWRASNGSGCVTDYVEHYPGSGGTPTNWGNNSQSFHSGMNLGEWGYTTHGCTSVTYERSEWLYRNIPTINVEGVSSRCIALNTTGFLSGEKESDIKPREVYTIALESPFD